MASANGQRVLVVGAGVSGLAAAYRLKAKGFDVTVLERGDYIGGKARTVTENGYIMEEGASVLPSKYTNVLGLVRELGLESELIPGGSIVGFARGSTIHYLDSAHLIRDALSTKLISFGSKLRMARLAFDNLRIMGKLDYEDITSAAAWDVETAKQSVVDFFFSFNNVIGSKLLSFRKGMGFFPHALAEKGRIDVRLGARVEEVSEKPGSAVVTWSDAGGSHTEEVAGVVVAVASHVASRLVPSLPKGAHDVLDSIGYTTSVNVSLGLRRPPADNPAFVIQIPRSVHPDLFGIVLEHNKAPGRVPEGKGMASLYTMSDWAEKLIGMDDESVVDQVTAAAEKVLPGLSKDVEFAHISRWYPVIVYSVPGTYRSLVELKQHLAPFKRVRFAGDYFSCSNMNTAVAGGERAARELGTTLLNG